jgi:hypothetical protein
MRALTLRPHWAHAVAHMGKRIENRSRPIPKALVGHRVAIHAGATLPKGWALEIADHDPGANPGPIVVDAEDLAPAGVNMLRTRCIVATAIIQPRTGLWTWAMEGGPDLPHWADPEADYWWTLEDVRTLASPIPMQRGQLGLWHLPEDISKQLENQ